MIKCCDNGCKSCHKYSIKEIDKLLYKVKNTISSYSEEWYNKEKYDFKSCSPYLVYLIGVSYLRVLERHREFLIYKIKPTLKDGKMSDFVEKVLDYVKYTKTVPLNEDRTSYEFWATMNPKCAGYENWEIALRKVACEDVSFEEFVEKYNCNYLFDISQHNVSCEVLFNIIDYNINKEIVFTDTNETLCRNLSFENFVKVINCDINLSEKIYDFLGNCKLDFTESIIKKCQLQHNELIEKHNCSLTFLEYLNIIDCGISFELISELYSCNIQVIPNVENKCPDIVVNSNIYSLCDTMFKEENKNIIQKLIQINLL